MYFICVLLYRKRPVATGVNRFPAVLLYFPNCETGNRKNPKSGQPQPVVWLHSVASGPVSVFFLVHATGLADTKLEYICEQLESICEQFESSGVTIFFPCSIFVTICSITFFHFLFELSFVSFA